MIQKANNEAAYIPAPTAQMGLSQDGRMFSGYASVFNYPIATYSGWDGPSEVNTFISPGAFKNTIGQMRDKRLPAIQALYNHGLDPAYGQLPIGRIVSMDEDSVGLRADIELHDGPANDNLKAAMRNGALSHMSIQFDVVDAQNSEDGSERHIRQVRLYEFGPVTFPANQAAKASLHSFDPEAFRAEIIELVAGASSDRGSASTSQDDSFTVVRAKHMLAFEQWETELKTLREKLERK